MSHHSSLVSLVVVAIVLPSFGVAGCSGDSGKASGPVGVSAQDDGGTSPDADWTNPGCSAKANVVDAGLRLDLHVDLTRYEERLYSVRERVSVRPRAAGNSITLFGTTLGLGRASHGYAYDGQRATFCTGEFAAGDEVTVEVEYVISEKMQAFPKGSLAGMRVWGSSEFAVGPFTSPFFSSTWLLVPQSVHWIDDAHAGNVVVDRVDLAVTVPDSEWTVVGPGKSKVDGPTWSFASEQPMPLYTFSFAASPHYQSIDLGKTEGGVPMSAAVFSRSRDDATRHLELAGRAVDIMSERIGAFPFSLPLRYAEIPTFAGGMEHTGSVWLGTTVFDGTATGDQAAIHETVHHWWGNDVKIADWPHFWMSEGFTEWTTVFMLMDQLVDPATALAWKKRYRKEAAAMSQPMAGKPAPGPLRFADGTNMMEQVGANLLFFYRYGAGFLEMINQRLKKKHGDDLARALKDWHAQKRGHAVTTEDFRDFLAERTQDAAGWKTFFDQWAFQGPSPTLELTSFGYGQGSVEVDVRRVGSTSHDLDDLEVVFIANGKAHPARIALPKGKASAIAKIAVPAKPDAIVIDPAGLYVLEVSAAAGFTGPPIDNVLPWEL